MSSTNKPSLSGDAILRAARNADALERSRRYYKRQSWQLARKMDLQQHRAARRPSDLGLTAAEVWSEYDRLRSLGWSPSEIASVLPYPGPDPRTVAA